MNFEKLDHVFPRWRQKTGWLWIGAAVIVLLIGMSVWSKFSFTPSAKEVSEEEQVVLVEKLIAMQMELSSIKSDLEKKKSSGQKFVSRPQPTKRVVLGFEGKGGFQDIRVQKSDHYIPRGSVFKALTVTSIKTSISESFVVAQTTETFEMDRKRAIPKGTRLIGTARLNPMLKGLIVRFDTMVLPSGKQLDGLNLLALDGHAFPELSGIYFSDKATVYGSALAFGFLSGFSSAAQDRESTLSGSIPTPSLKNQVLGGLSAASFTIAEDMLKDIQDKAIEYVVLPAGEEIFVVFDQKLDVDPERGLR